MFELHKNPLANKRSLHNKASNIGIAPTIKNQNDITNLNCPECNGDIMITAIKELDSDFAITFICQNGHQIANQRIQELMNNPPKEGHRFSNGKCLKHNEDFSYYCHDTEKNICKKCFSEGNHRNHKHEDIFNLSQNLLLDKDKYSSYFRGYIDNLDKAKENLNNQIKELQEQINNYFVKIASLLTFQYYYTTNANTELANYELLQSYSFLTQKIDNNKIFPPNIDNVNLPEFLEFFYDRVPINIMPKEDPIDVSNLRISANAGNNDSSVTAIYNVKDIDKKTLLFGADFTAFTRNNCTMSIDGELVEYTNLYKFNSLGMHIVKVTMNHNDFSDLNLTGMFRCCLSLEEVDLADFNFNRVTKMNNLVSGCVNLKKINFGNNVDTSRVVEMKSVFNSCKSLKYVDVSRFDTSKLKSLSYFFFGCSSLIKVDLNNWDISNVEDLSYMFYCCFSLEKVECDKWDTSRVTTMNEMFYLCYSLKDLNVSTWNTSSCVDFRWLFDSCSSLPKLDLSRWNTRKVLSMRSMFKNCNELKELNIGNWNVAKNKCFDFMFFGDYSLQNMNLSRWRINKDAETKLVFKFCPLLRDENKFNLNNN